MAGGSGALAHDRAERDAPKAWRDLRLRVASAVVLAPCGLAALWYGGMAWQVLILLLAIGMALEWMTLCRAIRMPAPVATGWGVAYLVPAAVALVWLRDAEAVGRANVLFIVFVVWASDIGAYLAGRMFGGRKLAPMISPGKTWSGAFGGLTSVMLVGGAAAFLVPGGVALHGVAVACVLGIAAQLGDLLESALKRHFGVKDSGRIIPGHGGLLDRLDGMLIAAPVAAILALILGRGMILWQ